MLLLLLLTQALACDSWHRILGKTSLELRQLVRLLLAPWLDVLLLPLLPPLNRVLACDSCCWILRRKRALKRPSLLHCHECSCQLRAAMLLEYALRRLTSMTSIRQAPRNVILGLANPLNHDKDVLFHKSPSKTCGQRRKKSLNDTAGCCHYIRIEATERYSRVSVHLTPLDQGSSCGQDLLQQRLDCLILVVGDSQSLHNLPLDCLSHCGYWISWNTR